MSVDLTGWIIIGTLWALLILAVWLRERGGDR